MGALEKGLGIRSLNSFSVRDLGLWFRVRFCQGSRITRRGFGNQGGGFIQGVCHDN